MWSEGTFVLDANVLLNLYRYPESGRNQLIEVLESLRGRIWIPHHVALEFQRNRPVVIAEQKRRFQEVREICSRTLSTFTNDLQKLKLNERHSLIDPTGAQESLRKLLEDFQAEISALEDNHLDVHQEDELRARLDDLLHSCVGPEPDQAWVDDVQRRGVERYALSVPPGFADAQKGQSEARLYQHAGIKYERQYGDLIVWCQLLDLAQVSSPKALVFVTDDEKSDWWWIEAGKTLGPRPELVEEMARVGRLDSFHMYKTATFLQHARTYIATDVSDDTIAQVETIARDRDGASDWMEKRAAVEAWLNFQHNDADVQDTLFPDFTIRRSDQSTLHVEVVSARTSTNLPMRVTRELDSLASSAQGPKDEVEVVVVCQSPADLSRQVRRFSMLHIKPRRTVTFGFVDEESEPALFLPMHRISGASS